MSVEVTVPAAPKLYNLHQARHTNGDWNVSKSIKCSAMAKYPALSCGSSGTAPVGRSAVLIKKETMSFRFSYLLLVIAMTSVLPFSRSAVVNLNGMLLNQNRTCSLFGFGLSESAASNFQI